MGKRVLVGFGMVLLAVCSLTAASDLRLVNAVKNRDIHTVRTLLAERVDVNAAQADGATALQWAAHWDDGEVTDLLIRAGAHVNAANDWGVTPLMLACTNGSGTMVERLLKAGANPNTTLPTGETALMTASRTGSVVVVNALLDRGADWNAHDSTGAQTALMWAVAEGHVDVARALLAHGANVNARSKTGFTALMFAARQGDIQASRLLLEGGAGVNAAASDGSSPLLVAVVRGHVPLAEFLLDRGADPNADGAGYTALHWAAGSWESLFTHDYSLESGEWRSLIGLPATRKLEFIKTLLAHGANPNARIRKDPPRYGFSWVKRNLWIGATPFYTAAAAVDTGVMRLLAANGAVPRLTASNKTTPLMAAAGLTHVDEESRGSESARLEATKLALDLGVDIGAANDDGYTALHSAAFGGFDSVVQYLVNKGAELNMKNKIGKTPLGVAEGYQRSPGQIFTRPSTAALLRKLGAAE